MPVQAPQHLLPCSLDNPVVSIPQWNAATAAAVARGAPAMSFDLQQQLVNPLPTPTNSSSAASLPVVMEKHMKETEQHVLLYEERLRAVLLQQADQQTAALLRLFERKASAILSLKDEELAKAQRRSTELEQLMQRAEEQRLTWQRAARDSEAAAAVLSGAIEQLRTSFVVASSCSDSGGGGETPPAIRKAEPLRPPCRSCGSRDSCVVMMPCRHVCSCKPCAALLGACPLCGAPKRDSIEILFGMERANLDTKRSMNRQK